MDYRTFADEDGPLAVRFCDNTARSSGQGISMLHVVVAHANCCHACLVSPTMIKDSHSLKKMARQPVLFCYFLSVVGLNEEHALPGAPWLLKQTGRVLQEQLVRRGIPYVGSCQRTIQANSRQVL